MTITVMTVEGVIRQNNGDGVIHQGQLLYHALASTSKVALVSNSLHEDKVEYWLRINGFRDHAYLFCARTDDPFEVAGSRLRQIRSVTDTQHAVDLVIDPDPEIAAALMHEGIPTMLFLHPRYSRPEFRPDHEEEVTPWDRLVAEVDSQALLRTADTRPDND